MLWSFSEQEKKKTEQMLGGNIKCWMKSYNFQ